MSQTTASARRARIRWLLGAAVSIGILVWLIRSIDTTALSRRAASLDPGWLLLALLVAYVDRALVIVKWQALVRALTGAVSLRRAARVYMATMFASLVLPPYIGNDVLRAVSLGRRQQLIAEIGTSVVVERAFGILTLGAVCLLSLALLLQRSAELEHVAGWMLGLVVVATIAVWLVFSAWGHRVGRRWRGRRGGRWFAIADRVNDALAAYRRRPLLLWGFAIASILEQALVVIFYWLGAKALDVPAGAAAMFAAIPLACFMARLPIGIWGMGVMEATVVYLLRFFGITAADALAIALLGRLVELGSIIPGAFLLGDLATGGEPRLRKSARGKAEAAVASEVEQTAGPAGF
ncbi:MAG TPA: lysylphosphatidylglycerol synthase transmembrane domain-containing protein [Gemmatimonadales bacterium]|nr:lysylphosphatidylglycerol synthase transmembrane domain-containing protein [Gemmatimonadales bacterium]